MKSLKNLTGDSLEQLIDYKVVDQNGDEIGSLHSLWSDPDTGAVEFLGVKTGWIFGQNHVVPAEKAELDDAGNVVRLPYTETFIKEAPAIPADDEISEEEENNIYQYYGLTRESVGRGAADSTAAPAASSGSAYAGADSTSGVAEGDALSTTRWRRTRARGPIADAAAGGEIRAGEAVRSALDDLSPADSSGTRTPMTPATTGAYGTTNLYGSTGGSTPPVAEDSLGAKVGGSGPADDDVIGTVGAATRGGGAANADPISGEPGSHPIGTGMGAVGGGIAGAAIGGAVAGAAVGGPVGAAIGAVVGTVGGGLAGKGVAEAINPTEENAYWESNYRNADYFQNDYEYADYAPAYRVGYEGYGKYGGQGRDYSQIETDLERDYTQARGGSRLGWEHAKAATRDAWERLKAKASDVTK